MWRVISVAMCSSAWWVPSNMTSGSASSTATLSETLTAQSSASLVALPDREALHDRRVGGRDRRDLGCHLRVAVVAGPPSGELRRSRDRGGPDGQQAGQEQRHEPGPRDGEARHAHRVTPRRPSVTHRTDQPRDDGRPGTLPRWPISGPSSRRPIRGARSTRPSRSSDRPACWRAAGTPRPSSDGHPSPRWSPR